MLRIRSDDGIIIGSELYSICGQVYRHYTIKNLKQIFIRDQGIR